MERGAAEITAAREVGRGRGDVCRPPAQHGLWRRRPHRACQGALRLDLSPTARTSTTFSDLHKMIPLLEFYDLIITFRYLKAYSGKRQFISWLYNHVLRFLCKTSYRDISTGFRIMRRSLLKHLEFSSESPLIGAEIAIETMLKGYRVGEVGIQTFPREFGTGSSTSYKNIVTSDMMATYRKIFSHSYELPANRKAREMFNDEQYAANEANPIH